jgi:hypothetical protein
VERFVVVEGCMTQGETGDAWAGAEQWLTQWSESARSRADSARELADRVSRLTSSATALDDAVRVTVSGDGRLLDLALSERAGRVSMDRVAQAILTAVARAQAGLVEKVGSLVDATVGADTAEGRAVTQSFARRFPPPDPPSPTSTADARPGTGR